MKLKPTMPKFPMLYHGTSSILLPSIKELGLLPQSEVLNKKMMPYIGSSENPNYISLTTDKQKAWQFADITARQIGGNSVILVFQRGDLLHGLFYEDPEEQPHKDLLLYDRPIKENFKLIQDTKNAIINYVLKESMINQIDKELQPVMKKFWNTFGTGNISTESCIGHNESSDTFQHFYIKLNNKEIEEKPLLQFFLASVFKKPNIKEQEEDGQVVISTKYFKEDGSLPEGVNVEDVKKANKLALEDFNNVLDEYTKTNVLKKSKTILVDSSFAKLILEAIKEEIVGQNLGNLEIETILNHAFRQYNVHFVEGHAGTSQHANQAEVYISQASIYNNFAIYIEYEPDFWTIFEDDTKWPIFVDVIEKLVEHELTHREQMKRILTKTNDYRLQQIMSKGSQATSEYLSKPQELMSFANESVKEFLQQGYSEKQILNLIKSPWKNESPSRSESDIFWTYTEWFTATDLPFKRFLKYMFSKLI